MSLRDSLAVLFPLCLAGLTFAQAGFPAAFVSNNGNLRGSVSSYSVHPTTGNLALVQELLIGARASSAPSIPGTNAISITLTPDGQYLAATHATASTTVEQVTIVAVNPNATLTLATIFNTDDSPLDSAWLSDDVLAVTRTRVSGTNQVVVYRFDREDFHVQEIDRENVGVFCSYITVSPDRRHLFAADSSGLTVRAFTINPDGTLLAGTTLSTPCYPLGLHVHIDGLRIYAGGGISAGGRAILGLSFDPDSGEMAVLPGSPYNGRNTNPKEALSSPDGRFLCVGYSDGLVRMFDLETPGGVPGYVGFAFQVGGQGELGNLAVMRLPVNDRQVLLMTDKESFTLGTGLISTTILSDGSLMPNGDKVASGGISPTDIAAWIPPLAPPPFCPADYNQDGGVDGADIEAFFRDWEAAAPGADVNQDGGVTGADVEVFFAAWEAGGCG